MLRTAKKLRGDNAGSDSIQNSDQPRTIVDTSNDGLTDPSTSLPEPLSSSSDISSSFTSTDDLIKYVPEVMPDGHILWTHVTSPFISPDIYCEIINKYFKNLDRFDSLMTVTKLQKFIWNDTKPVNYDRSIEKWPRTQTIEPLWEVNSGAFLTSKTIYQENIDRIGNKPYLFELSDEIAFDIDWLPDYKIAEALYYSKHSLVGRDSGSLKIHNNKKYKRSKQKETV